jgi:hypothetical protein
MALSLFAKKPVAQPIEDRGGVAILRAALHRRHIVRREHLTRLQQELGVSNSTLRDFAEGTGNLSPAQLRIVAGYLYHNVTYDADRDLLVSLVH